LDAPADEREALVLDHVFLVEQCARSLGRLARARGLDPEDLHQQGLLGLVKAAGRYIAGHYSFEPYAHRAIKNSMLSALVQHEPWETNYDVGRIPDRRTDPVELPVVVCFRECPDTESGRCWHPDLPPGSIEYCTACHQYGGDRKHGFPRPWWERPPKEKPHVVQGVPAAAATRRRLSRGPAGRTAYTV
jgi:hypothetical protein